MKAIHYKAVIDAVLPAVANHIRAALGSIRERLAALEAAKAVDVQALVATEVAKAMAAQPKVGDLVAAAVKDLTPAPLTLEVDTDKIKAVVDEAVAGITVDFEEVSRVVDERVSKAIDALPKVPTAEAVAALVKTPTAEEVAALVPPPPTAEEVAALIPAPKDGDPGKSVTLDEVRPLVDQAVGAAFATVRVPEDGKDADPEVTAALVASEVQKAVAALPVAEPGKDADPEVIKAMVDEAVAAIPRIVQDGKDATPEQIAAAVAKYLKDNPPKDGEPGKSVSVDDLWLTVDEAVSKRMAEIPTPKDGVGLAGMLIDRDGELVATLTDGTTKKLGPVVGKDGEPGLGYDEMTEELADDGRTIVRRYVRDGQVKEYRHTFAVVLDRGVYKDGTEYSPGDAVSFGGSIWIAQRATTDKPSTSDAFRLAVKKGRDGKDAPQPPAPPKPVKL